jgi:hypothetical protein
MNTRAETEKLFWFKFLAIGLLVAGVGVWHAKDAIFEAPKKLELAQAWEPLLKDTSIDEPTRILRWEEIATANGWDTKRPKAEDDIRHAHDYRTFNYGVAILCTLIAIPSLVWCLRSKGTWIESTENGLRNSSGQELSCDQITKIDKAKWDKKGIAVVHYQNDGKPSQTFIIDDLKFNRAATDQIMAWVETQVQSDVIVNGRTEVQIAADNAEKQRLNEQKQEA